MNSGKLTAMLDLGQYSDKESPVHSCDPRVKLLSVLALSIVILRLDSIGLIVTTGIVFTFSLLANIGIAVLLKCTRPVWPFFAMLFIIYALFTPGNSILPFSSGPFMISNEGLHLGVFQVGKFLLLILIASLLTMTTPPSELTIGVERLLRPLHIIGISSHNIALMVSMALRFIPMLYKEMNNIQEAQLARGANYQPGSLSGKIRSMICIAAPLTISILRRSDELVEAMEARGYQPGQRTYLHELAFTRKDYFSLGVILFIITVLCCFT